MFRRPPVAMSALLAVLLLGAVADGAAGVDPQQAVIRELEQQQARLALAGDRAGLEKLFATEFRVINPAGAVATKAELLDILAGSGPSPYRSATYATHDVTVRGETAWSTGIETVVFARDALGSRAGQVVQRRITHVWEKQGGQWRLVLRHATNISSP